MTYTISTDHYGADTIDLGAIKSEQHKVGSELQHDNYPLSGTKTAEAYDGFGGVKRVISISGTKNASTKASLLDDFIVKMNALQNGDQDTVVFHSELWDNSTTGDYTDGKFNVKVNDFTFTYTTGNPNTINYSLVLFESA